MDNHLLLGLLWLTVAVFGALLYLDPIQIRRRPADPLEGEVPLADSTQRMIGKTILEIDASSCNNVVFSFTDGTKVALHIDCDSMGLPTVDTCTECA